MTEAEKQILRKFPHKTISLGVTEDGHRRSIPVPWQMGCNAYNMRTPDIWLSPAELSDEELWAELGRLRAALEYMSCELSYRMTPLAALCRGAANGGLGGQFLTALAAELEKGTAPDVQVCVYTLLTRMEPTKLLRRQLAELGATLGRFDLPGQLRGLERSIRETEQALRSIREGAPERRRSYQTLGLCTGAAMAILLL